jgi:hypothetical protein
MAAEHLGNGSMSRDAGTDLRHLRIPNARKLPNAKNHRRMRSGETRPHLRNDVDSIVCS